MRMPESASLERFMAVFLTAICIGGPSLLVAQQSGAVNVDISNLRNDIALKLKVDAGAIPVSVQAPREIAARACGLDIRYFSSQDASGGANCAAKSSSAELEQIVQSQLKASPSAGASR